MTRRFATIVATATALVWPCSLVSLVKPAAGSGLADTASNSFLQSLAKALNDEGLYETVNANVTNTTLLGPTDTAFSTFSGSSSGLYLTNSAAWSGHLMTLLLFHLVDEDLTLAEIFDGVRGNLTTVTGLNISVDQTAKTLQQGATISISDILADGNNLLQVVDQVLIPANLSRTFVENLALDNIPQLPDKKARFNQEGYSIQNFLVNDASDLGSTLYSATNTNGTTVFIPPNSVYLEFIQRFVLGALLSEGNSYFVTQFLQYQALPWNFYKATSHLQYGTEFHTPSLLGPSVWLTYQDDDLYFNGARVFAPDQLSSNGVAHMVSSFFPPPTTRDMLNYTTLATAHEFGQLFGILNQQNFSIGDVGASLGGDGGTLFAAVDMAFFDQISQQTLLRWLDPTWHLHLKMLIFNHITAGKIKASELVAKAPFALTMANGHTIDISKSTDANGTEVLLFGEASVFLTDLIGLDGVFHGIDQLMIPSDLTRTLLDVIQHDTELTTFDKYINQFSLQQNVSDTLAITVLAPPNSAWDSADIIESLLGGIVQGQIIQQVWTTDELVDGTVIQATNGQELNVTRIGSDIYIHGVKIVQGDILGFNGVVHKMEGVVIDYNSEAPPPVVAPTLQPVTNYPTPFLATPGIPTAPTVITGIGTNGSACEARSGSGCAPSALNRTVIRFRPTDPPTPTSAAAATGALHLFGSAVAILSATLVMLL